MVGKACLIYDDYNLYIMLMRSMLGLVHLLSKHFCGLPQNCPQLDAYRRFHICSWLGAKLGVFDLQKNALSFTAFLSIGN